MMVDGRAVIQVREVVIQHYLAADCECVGHEYQKVSAWSGHAVAERGRREVQNAFDRRSRRAAYGAGRSCSDRGILEEENAFHRPAVRRGKRGDNRTIHRDWAIGEAKSLCQDECDSVAAKTAVDLDVQAAPGENVGTGFEPDI